MRKHSPVRVVRFVVAASALAGVAPCLAHGQSTTSTHAASHDSAATKPSPDQIATFAKLTVAISQARDSAQKLLALSRNATPAMQQQLRDQLATQVTAMLRGAQMSDADFRRQTFLVSTDTAARTIYDQTIAKLTGNPTPGQTVAVAAAAAAVTVAVPATAAGMHLGHIMNGFADTPGGQGLLPVAMAEARTAAQHAALAARDTGNLAAMKLHAGHVINAVDPTVVAQGPGLGYGVKRAALGMATHADLAIKAAGATPQIVTNVGHVAVSARNTVLRSDQIVVLAKKIQAATSTGEAVSLVSQLVALTTELVAGRDADADGTTTWKEGEGGLQHCEEQMRLALAPSPTAP